jgi:hypothetical protein
VDGGGHGHPTRLPPHGQIRVHRAPRALGASPHPKVGRHSFPRDPLTAERYRKAGLAAAYVGNLMMDCLEFGKEAFGYAPDEPVVLLLPGSRRDAPANFRLLLQTAARVAAVHPEVRWLCALSPTVDPTSLARAAGAELLEGQMAWGVTGADHPIFHGRGEPSHRGAGDERDRERAGRGARKPVVALPGPGPQFTRKFLALQARLLGEALVPAEGPEEAARAVLRLLANPEERARRGEAGRARMGPPGGADRLARWLVGRRGQMEDRI